MFLFKSVCLRVFLQAFNNGIDAIKKIVREKNISGVYGPLIENFKCNEKFFTAVEVTAGNRLSILIILIILIINHA